MINAENILRGEWRSEQMEQLKYHDLEESNIINDKRISFSI